MEVFQAMMKKVITTKTKGMGFTSLGIIDAICHKTAGFNLNLVFENTFLSKKKKGGKDSGIIPEDWQQH